MDEGLLRLCFGIQSGPGLYALLLGSGVSRAASMPTGWEVVLHLVRQVAAARGGDPEPDPAGWYEQTFGVAPDYTDLLSQVTSTPAERSQLLSGFFEPTAEERQRGEKLPTGAHRAIARLMRDGFVRVVVTTNFDRLLEQSLSDEAVQPTVVSSVDDIAGAPPLSHARSLVVKVHGDYLDARIRNTRDELAEYEPEMERLLERIFGDYGLIVAGWSGVYDTALRNLLERATNSMYGTYWAARGNVDTTAQGVLDLRDGQMIAVRDADTFFSTLEEQVRALQRLTGTTALTAAVAANRVKAYVVDERHRIDLHDLAQQEVEGLTEQLTPERFPMDATPPPAEVLLERLAEYEALTENAFAVIATGGRWGGPEHVGVWVMMIDRLLNPARLERNGSRARLDLQRYPALLLLYGAGIGMVAGGQEQLLADLLTRPEPRDPSLQDQSTTFALIANLVVDQQLMKTVYRPSENQGYQTPVSQYLFHRLREPLRSLIPDDGLYERYFDRFEYLAALIQAHRAAREVRGAVYFHIGRFASHRPAERSMPDTVQDEIERVGEAWPLLAAGEFDGSLERLQSVKTDMDQRIRQAVP